MSCSTLSITKSFDACGVVENCFFFFLNLYFTNSFFKNFNKMTAKSEHKNSDSIFDVETIKVFFQCRLEVRYL